MAGCERFEACSVFALDGGDPENAGQRCQLIEPFDRLRSVKADRLRRRRRHSVLRAALATTALEKPAGGLWTATDARIRLLPYQLEPSLSVLAGATRVLLADDVGLGKTIQAGLILSELRARGLVDRTLILTPAGLREMWASELRDRFGLEARILDHAAVAEQAATLPASINPWTLKGITVSSLDFAKRAEVLAAIEEAPFDLLIADEAHHLTPNSDRGAAVARLASRVPWVVLVSATPHSGDEDAFKYLTTIGALGDRLEIFRRSRSDVGLAAERRTHLLPVCPQPSEAEMLRATERYARAIFQARGASEPGVRLVAMTLARRAASSAAALCRTLTRRLALMSGAEDPSPRQQPLPWEDVDSTDDDDDTWLGCAGLDDVSVERREIEELILLARQSEPRASKIHRLVRILEFVREPVVIFTEYRDTLEALQRALAPGRSIVVIHGGLAPAARQHAVDRFTRGDAHILIATDAAGEGLNLHQRCRLVINIELPWNPLRLEQRVGRVDRIGQSRRVHAIHLFHRHSIEETVLARLERRRLNAQRGLAHEGHWMSEEDIAHTVLGPSPPPALVAPRIHTSVVSHAGTEAARAEGLRRLRDGRIPDSCWALPQRRSPATRRVILLHVVDHLDTDSRLHEEYCLPLVVDLAAVPRNRQQWRIAIDALARDTGIRRACLVEAERRAEAAALTVRPLVEAVVFRVGGIRARLARAPLALRQVSLFDRRSEREAETRQQVRTRIDAHLEQRARQVFGLLSNHRLAIRLFAMWPDEG